MVHQHQQAPGRNLFQDVFLVYENAFILLVFFGNIQFAVKYQFFQFLQGRAPVADHNKRGFVPGQGQLGHPDGAADGIIIFIGMAHNKDLVRFFHLLPDVVGHDPGPHPCAFGADRISSAKILHLLVAFHHDLVAAAAQGKVQRLGCVHAHFLQRIPVFGDADADGRSQLVLQPHLPHLVQDGKFIIDCFLQVFIVYAHH